MIMARKFIVLLLVMLLVCGGSFAESFVEENVSTEEIVSVDNNQMAEPGEFSGFYICDQYLMNIIWSDDCYYVYISRLKTNNTFICWEYYGSYDPDTQTITTNIRGDCSYDIIDNDGFFVSSEQKYTNGLATFTMDDDHCVTWVNQTDEDFSPLKFQLITKEFYGYDVTLHRLMASGLLKDLSEDEQLYVLQYVAGVLNDNVSGDEFTELTVDGCRSVLTEKEQKRVGSLFELILWVLTTLQVVK